MVMAQDSTKESGIDGESATHGRGNAVARARVRKANAALELKLAGGSWQQIAEVCGYPTPRAAKVAVERALERELKAGSPDDKAKMRLIAGKRLEAMLRSVWGKATNPEDPDHLSAQREARAHISEYTKLYGLAAPAEVVVYTPQQEEMQQWVARMMASQGADVEEADLFDDDIEDAEVVEDERAISA